MLTARRQQVLAALISEYVAHALPVASKALVEGYPLGVSSATVRNELSALEVEGYIRQPHTSAGRIPTDFGYRNFVDGLLSVDELIEDEMASQAMHDAVRDARSFTELFNRSSALLTRLTTCLDRRSPADAIGFACAYRALDPVAAAGVQLVARSRAVAPDDRGRFPRMLYKRNHAKQRHSWHG